MDKKNIIYILWVWFSWSTLLNFIFWSDKESIAVWEINNFSKYIKEKQQEIYCDCWETIYNCELWKKIIEKWYFNNLFLPQWRLLEPFYVFFNILFHKNIKNEKLSKMKIYKEIYKEILTESSKIYHKEIYNIIDSSKEAKKLYYLKQAWIDNIKVIYIIRDIRWVLLSYKWKWYSYIRWYINWILTNLTCRILLKKYFVREEYEIILYDHFIQKPDIYIDLLRNKYWLNINIDDFFKNYKNNTYHNFWWNISKNNNFNKLNYIKKWDELSTIKRLLLDFFSYVPNKIFFNDKI